jgi:long-subunit fatty acid transport protein
VLVAILLLPYIALSQNSDFGNWLIYIGNNKLNSKWNIHNEVQYRNYNTIGDLEQLLIRTGLGYTFNDKKNNVLLGYGYILSENYISNSDNKATINEHRIFQQFTASQTFGKVKLGHRYRFEQRFVESDFKMRFRYFLSLNIPINIMQNNKYYLSAYNEIFLNTKTSVFDRNRLYGGIGYNINTAIRIEVGYMNQFFERSSKDQLNIITFVNL